MRPRNLTRKEKILAAGKKLNPDHWWVIWETPGVLVLVSKTSSQRRTIKKEG